MAHASFALASHSYVRVSGSRQGTRRVTSTRVAASSSAASEAQPAVVILPGLGNETSDYLEFADELEQRGFSVTVAEVRRPDWLRNAAGLVDVNYWKGTLSPRPTVDWYLGRIDDAIKSAQTKSNQKKVKLVAHSAGGWMARVYLSDYGTDDISALTTLGSPLNSVPKDVPGVVDQTRGILTFVEANCDMPTELNEKASKLRVLRGSGLKAVNNSISHRPRTSLSARGTSRYVEVVLLGGTASLRLKPRTSTGRTTLH